MLIIEMDALLTLTIASAILSPGLAVPLTHGDTPTNRTPEVHGECRFEPSERQSCGMSATNELECRARGCCWEKCEGCADDVPWCFLAHRMLRKECLVKSGEKMNCGYHGITEGECLLKGCCWAPPSAVNDPPCFETNLISRVRLVNGPDQSEGRLELKHNGEWGTVCDDNFGEEEANIVCRILGYSSGRARTGGSYGQGANEILLDDLECSGEERWLGDCQHPGWGVHNCNHYEDVGLKCSN